jgi:hypothetical protein
MDPFSMVVMIVFLSMVAGISHKYLDTRASIARAQGGTGDKNVLRAVEELRAEIAALKRHETDAVLSFDSTLQTLDARVKHLEQRALGEGTATRTVSSAPAPAAVEAPTRVSVGSGAAGGQSSVP